MLYLFFQSQTTPIPTETLLALLAKWLIASAAFGMFCTVIWQCLKAISKDFDINVNHLDDRDND